MNFAFMLFPVATHCAQDRNIQPTTNRRDAEVEEVGPEVDIEEVEVDEQLILLPQSFKREEAM